MAEGTPANSHENNCFSGVNKVRRMGRCLLFSTGKQFVIYQFVGVKFWPFLMFLPL